MCVIHTYIHRAVYLCDTYIYTSYIRDICMIISDIHMDTMYMIYLYTYFYTYTIFICLIYNNLNTDRSYFVVYTQTTTTTIPIVPITIVAIFPYTFHLITYNV